MKADVVVIGAGALGLSTALHCALLGRSVIVVERDTAGSQASGRAAGLFKSVQADELRTRLARRSIEQAVSFADWAGIPLPVARCGSFLVARTAQHKAFIRAEAGQSRAWGAPVREAAAAELAGRVSYYRGSGEDLAVWCPEDIYVEEPMSLVRAYAAACRSHGVEMLESEAVLSLPVSDGRVTGVETTARSITADVAVVDAAGAWVRQVAELAGARVAVAPVRHQLLITEPSPELDPADPITRVVDAAVYLRPARGGLMFGGFEAPTVRRYSRVRDETASRGEDALGCQHPVDVLRARLVAHEDDLPAGGRPSRPRRRPCRHDLADCRAGRRHRGPW